MNDDLHGALQLLAVAVVSGIMAAVTYDNWPTGTGLFSVLCVLCALGSARAFMEWLRNRNPYL